MLSLEVTEGILSNLQCSTVLFSFALCLMFSIIQCFNALSVRSRPGKPRELADFGMEYSRTYVFLLESQGRVGEF